LLINLDGLPEIGINKTIEKKARLFQIKGKKNCKIIEVPLTFDSLNYFDGK
jgi:hypothetical protein